MMDWPCLFMKMSLWWSYNTVWASGDSSGRIWTLSQLAPILVWLFIIDQNTRSILVIFINKIFIELRISGAGHPRSIFFLLFEVWCEPLYWDQYGSGIEIVSIFRIQKRSHMRHKAGGRNWGSLAIFYTWLAWELTLVSWAHQGQCTQWFNGLLLDLTLYKL